MKSYGMELILDLSGCDPELFTKVKLTEYFIEACKIAKMERHGDPMFWKDFESVEPHMKGISAVQFIKTSNITIHTLTLRCQVLINFFTCKDFDTDAVTEYSSKFFKGHPKYYQTVVRG